MPVASPSHIVVLPSIQEMFPEHLMRSSSNQPNATTSPRVAPLSFLCTRLPPRNHFLPAPLPTPLTQPGFGSGFGRPGRPPIRVSTAPSSAPVPVRLSPTPTATSSSSEGDAEEIEMSEEGGTEISARKHVCPRCGKRFNRPSSLRIHVNTHTGATPFRCPHPSCGRAFNVNSNMRRHFRNHGAVVLSSSSSPSASSSSPPSPVPSELPLRLLPAPQLHSHPSASEHALPTPSQAPASNIRFSPRSPCAPSPRSDTQPSSCYSPPAGSPNLHGSRLRPGALREYSESAVRGQVLETER